MKNPIGMLGVLLCIFFLMVLGFSIALGQPVVVDSAGVSKDTQGVAELLLGNATWQFYIASGVFTLIGVYLNTRRHVKKGVEKNPTSPAEFNIWWFLKDCVDKILGSLLINYLFVYFNSMWISTLNVNVQLATSLGFGLSGYGIDWFIGWLKSKTGGFISAPPVQSDGTARD